MIRCRSSMRSLTTKTADITRIGVNQTGAVSVVLSRLGSQEEKARPSREHRPAHWRETILCVLRLVWTLSDLAGVHVGQLAVGSSLLGITVEFQTSNVSSTRPWRAIKKGPTMPFGKIVCVAGDHLHGRWYSVAAWQGHFFLNRQGAF
jgi:hypothetical protein